MALETLRSRIAGKELFARAAEYDSAGNKIDETIDAIEMQIEEKASQDDLVTLSGTVDRLDEDVSAAQDDITALQTAVEDLQIIPDTSVASSGDFLSFDGTGLEWTELPDMKVQAGTDLKVEGNVVSVNTNGNVANSADMSFVAGSGTYARGTGSVAFGINTSAVGNRGAFSEGEKTYAEYDCHAEGYGTTASGDYAHAEGNETLAFGQASHAEGDYTKAEGLASHAEGYKTIAQSYYSHAEGEQTSAVNRSTHSEGYRTLASGAFSHAAGYKTSAIGDYSYAGGDSTIASSQSTYVIGKFNSNQSAAFVVGNGNSKYSRSDAFIVDWDGAVSSTRLATSGISDVESAITSLQAQLGNIETALNAIINGSNS